MVGEVGGLVVVISCNGWPNPLCGKGHVYGRALNCLMLVRHLGSSCLVSCWSYL